MNTENIGYKPYKCNKCGWVHAAIPPAVAQQSTDYDGYYKCFRCGTPSDAFVPAKEDDAPEGCTIQAVVVPGVWDSDDIEPATEAQHARTKYS